MGLSRLAVEEPLTQEVKQQRGLCGTNPLKDRSQGSVFGTSRKGKGVEQFASKGKGRGKRSPITGSRCGCCPSPRED